MASSSTSSDPKTFKYAVFLSFRGEDTRNNFVAHLHSALKRHCIHTFKDNKNMEKGERISTELIKAIEDSRFHIIVFSRNYASSSWCLDELVKIMECQKTTEQKAYPIFYDVEPTEIRKQIGAFGEAFAENEKKEDAWKRALTEAVNLSGFTFKGGDEAEFIDEIVGKISLELPSIKFSDVEKFIGMEARIRDVVSSLKTGVNEIRMIGIKGMGGAGKTTLAKAVFDQISCQFKHKIFVENVREKVSKDSSGLETLQKQVLSEVLKVKDIEVTGVTQGKLMMKEKMWDKEVLLVLDDVDDIEQLKALAEPSWFMQGSIIIITTRDEGVLRKYGMNSNSIHGVSLLSDEEAIRLFSWHAFGIEIPIPDQYKDLSRQVVRYAAGLPLTIRVLGLDFKGKDEDEWKDTLERLEKIPLEETLQRLELSYTSLEPDYKDIFLDVACFWKGFMKDVAIRALECCQLPAKAGLSVLERKSLITVDEDGRLEMHDGIQEMGWDIVRRDHRDEPERCSRLWDAKEIEYILANDLGSEATRGIKLWSWGLNPSFIMKGLTNMKKLRFLHVSVFYMDYNDGSNGDGTNDEVSQYFSNALQYLNWHRYPFSSLPITFQASNLVGLYLSNSNLVQLWEGGERKVLPKLRFLKIDESRLKTLDLMWTPNLETLDLEGCYNLVKLDAPIGCLKKITKLNLSGCWRFENFGFFRKSSFSSPELKLIVKSIDICPLHPDDSNLPKFRFECYYEEGGPSLIGNLEKLISVGLCACTKLEAFYESICDLRDLRKLELIGNIPEVPKDLGRLESLRELMLSSTQIKHLPDSICSLQRLKFLKLVSCWHLEKLPKDLGRLECLEELMLSSTQIKHLPDSICMLQRLKFLKLESCHLLERLPEDLGRLGCLEELMLSSTQIKHLPDSICLLQRLKFLKLESCHLLEKLPEDLGRLGCLEELMLSSTQIKHLPDSICMLQRLKSLKLHYCHLLEKLTTLNREGTPNLETNLDGTQNLETLKLDLCSHLVEVQMPAKCRNLKFLHINGSKLTVLDFAGALNLETLYLRDCSDLVEVQMPSKCRNLQFLHINGSKMTTIDLEGALNLEALYLQDCFDLVELQMPAECPKLKTLNLSRSKLKTLRLRTPNLESLNLEECSDLVVLHILNECPKLTYLSLRCSKLRTFNLMRTPNLKTLDLEGCYNLVKLDAPIGCLKEITKLSLSGCSRFEKFGFIKKSSFSSPELKLIVKSIDICLLHPDDSNFPKFRFECYYEEGGPSLIGNLEKLISVGLCACTKLESFYESMCDLRDLRKLELIGNIPEVPKDLGRLESLRELMLSSTQIKHLPDSICMLQRLKSLKLHYCHLLEKLTTLNREGTPNLETNLEGTQNLETLRLDRCSHLVEVQMPAKCRNLKFLHINSSKLTALDLEGALNLETLYLRDCSDLVEVQMPSKCRNLQFLHIIGSKLTTVDLEGALNLKTLYLLDCSDLVEVQMPAKCRNLKFLLINGSKLTTLDLEGALNLETLHLRDCSDLVELKMPAECPKLRTLNLISRSKLKTLRLRTPNLESLNLEECSDSVVLHMLNECPKLTYLSIRCSKLRTFNHMWTPNLETLDLKGCYNLVKLDAPIGCLKEITKLNLSGCSRFEKFGFIKKSSFSSPELKLIVKSIDICPLHPDDSNLPKFRFECYYDEGGPSLIGNLEKLISVGLCACSKLESFYESICDLRDLRKLELIGNIPEVPKDLGRLGSLEELMLSSPRIKYLPDSICMLKHLKFLNLESCPLLEKLPEDLDRLECLEKLTLWDCKSLKDIPDNICKMECLGYLCLCRCFEVEKLPEELGSLKCLKWLDIRDTHISHLPQSIVLLKDLCIIGSELLLQSCSFTSQIRTWQYETFYYRGTHSRSLLYRAPGWS